MGENNLYKALDIAGSKKELAKRLEVSDRTLRRWFEKGVPSSAEGRVVAICTIRLVPEPPKATPPKPRPRHKRIPQRPELRPLPHPNDRKTARQHAYDLLYLRNRSGLTFRQEVRFRALLQICDGQLAESLSTVVGTKQSNQQIRTLRSDGIVLSDSPYFQKRAGF